MWSVAPEEDEKAVELFINRREEILQFRNWEINQSRTEPQNNRNDEGR